jgi:hypothetical protein
MVLSCVVGERARGRRGICLVLGLAAMPGCPTSPGPTAVAPNYIRFQIDRSEEAGNGRRFGGRVSRKGDQDAARRILTNARALG